MTDATVQVSNMKLDGKDAIITVQITTKKRDMLDAMVWLESELPLLMAKQTKLQVPK